MVRNWASRVTTWLTTARARGEHPPRPCRHANSCSCSCGASSLHVGFVYQLSPQHWGAGGACAGLAQPAKTGKNRQTHPPHRPKPAISGQTATATRPTPTVHRPPFTVHPLAVAFAAALLLIPAAAPAAELRAGVAKVDITPPVGTPLGGYADRKGGPSTGIHDPIYAKALVLDDGATRLAIVTTDLVGTNPEMTRRAAEAAGIPQDQLLLCATHTHSGPGAYGKGLFAEIALGKYRQEVFDHLTAGITRALKDAVAGLQPAKLAVGESRLPRFMRNRRKARIKDPALWLLRVDTREGKPLAALVNLTAHGTVLDGKNMEFSGDWMAFTQAYLEKEVPGLTALYANGAEGDISPNIPDNSSNFDGAKAHGEIGGQAALELYRTLQPQAEVKLAFKTTQMELPASLKAALVGTGKTTTLQYFAVNDALLISVPGEMITQLGLALKDHARRQGYRHPAIVGLANDHLGYLLTRAEMKKGGYEVTVSFFGDSFGEDLTVALATLIGGDVEPLKASLATPPDDRKKDPETPAPTLAPAPEAPRTSQSASPDCRSPGASGSQASSLHVGPELPAETGQNRPKPAMRARPSCSCSCSCGASSLHVGFVYQLSPQHWGAGGACAGLAQPAKTGNADPPTPSHTGQNRPFPVMALHPSSLRLHPSKHLPIPTSSPYPHSWQPAADCEHRGGHSHGGHLQ